MTFRYWRFNRHYRKIKYYKKRIKKRRLKNRQLKHKISKQKNKRKHQNLLLILPKDILKYLCSYLESVDVIALSITSKTMYDRMWDNIIYNLFRQCADEQEGVWNSNVEMVMQNACSEYGNRTKHPYSIDAYYSDYEECINCSIFPWKIHSLRVEYVYGPRDVDILSWYCNRKRVGYTMM